MFSIRQAIISDIPEMNELYKNTVLTINRQIIQLTEEFEEKYLSK